MPSLKPPKTNETKKLKTTLPKTHYHYTLNKGLQELNGLKKSISKIGFKHNMGQELISHIQLCVEELIVNIVSYGFQEGGEVKIELDFQILDDHIHLSLSDNGKPFNPTLFPGEATGKQKKKPHHLKDIKPGGLGLILVKGFMDHIQYSHQEGWNRLTLKKKIKKFPGERPTKNTRPPGGLS